MRMTTTAVLLNILLGISGFYVMAYVLITGGFLDASPTPSTLGYLVIALYLLICFGTNYYVARQSSGAIKYSLVAFLIWGASFVGAVGLNRFLS